MMIRLYVFNRKLLEALKFIRENPIGFNDIPMYNELFIGKIFLKLSNYD